MKMLKAFATSIIFLVIFASSVCANSENILFSSDFSGSASGSAPVGFDEWKAGAWQQPLPTIEAVSGSFGYAATDVSSKLTQVAGCRESVTPYVRKGISNADENIVISVSMASADKNSAKSLYLNSVKQVSQDDGFMAVLFDTDGYIYSYGEVLCEYSLNQWYNIDVEIGEDTFSAYVNGILCVTGDVPDNVLAESSHLYYGIYGKTAQTASAVLYVDNLSVLKGAMPREKKISISSNTFDIENDTITGIEEEMTISDFVSNIITDGETLTVLAIDGTPVTDGNLSQGMTLQVVSGDGRNKKIYGIDCLNPIFVSPNNGAIIRDTQVNLSVSFIGEGTVEFYLDDSKIATDDTAPYTTTIYHGDGGDYTVWARITTSQGFVVDTEEVTYTYVENAEPSISITGVANGAEFAKGEAVVVTLEATDTDGTIEEISLVVDGVASKRTESSATFTLENLAIGRHEIYATAVDSDNAEKRTASVEFTVTNKEKADIDFTDFTNTMTWYPFTGSVGNVVTDTETGNDQYVLTADATTSTLMYDAQSSYFTQNRIYVEADMMFTDTNAKHELFIMRSVNAVFNIDAVIENGKLNGIYTVAPNEWFNIRYVWDMSEGFTEVWVLNKTTGIYELVNRNNSATFDGTLLNLRMNINKNSATGNIQAYFDNILIYTFTDDTYIKKVEYKNALGTEVADENGVGCDVKTINISFSNNIDVSTVNANTVILKEAGKTCNDYTVSSDGKNIIITLTKSVKSNTDYSIVIDRIKDENDIVIDTATVNFKTAFAEYDVTLWEVHNGGQPITSVEELSEGGDINLFCNVQNLTGATRESLLILVVYDGDTFVKADITEVVVASGTNKLPIASGSLLLEEAETGYTVYGYLWSDLIQNRNIEANSFIFGE